MKRLLAVLAVLFLGACVGDSAMGTQAEQVTKEYVGIVATMEYVQDKKELADRYERLYAMAYPTFGEGEGDGEARRKMADLAAKTAQFSWDGAEASVELAVVANEEIPLGEARERMMAFFAYLEMDPEEVMDARNIQVAGVVYIAQAKHKEIDETVMVYRIGDVWHVYD